MTDKYCSACDKEFTCAANKTDQICWCAELPIIMPSGFSSDCQCPECLKRSIAERIQQTMRGLGLAEKIVLAAPYADDGKLIEGIDFTLENGNYVFSAWHHLKRGTCCGSGCRNCPYEQVTPA